MSSNKIILGITASIAAYKSLELLRLLLKNGYVVKVVLTRSAERFATTTMLSALANDKVYTDGHQLADGMLHIELAKWADAIVIAPASANFIARLTNGFADELLTTVCLGTPAKIYIAPAMNKHMWHNPFTQTNITKLRNNPAIHLIEPEFGLQACGDVGYGRMPEPAVIMDKLTSSIVNQQGSLIGVDIIITAGGTREYIDPVRFIANKSSGKMGYALAQAAVDLGAIVTLIAANVSAIVAVPSGINKLFQCDTAEEMLEQINQEITASTKIFISCAAVSDFKVAKLATNKIKRSNKEFSLNLVPNPDIVKTIAARVDKKLFCVGFAAETENVIANAKEKLSTKGVDLIIANDVSRSDCGFDSDYNQITLITECETIDLGYDLKSTLAQKIMDYIAKAINI